tara:strand:- start:1151 stop:1615 length:465 start_codon:yes stop_codon:yes gene_type:complete
MWKIRNIKGFGKFLVLFVLIGTVGGGAVAYILKEAGVLKVEGIEEKYIYHLDTLYTQDYANIAVSEDLNRSKEWWDYITGKKSSFVGGHDVRYIKNFTRVKILEYSQDSTYARVYAKYEHGIAPRINTREGFVPTFTLHDTLPKDVVPIPYFDK